MSTTVEEAGQLTTQRGAIVDRFARRWSAGRYLCVGLDPVLAQLPPAVRGRRPVGQALLTFNRAIIEATADQVCAYKPNVAFYEAHGPEGIQALIDTVAFIKTAVPDVPVILDAKRGDIDNTSEHYATAVFDVVGADAATVHPFLGADSLAPFLSRADRGVFVLVKTSNPAGGEFQDLPVGPDGRPLFLVVAQHVAENWNGRGNCGVVVGAPFPAALRDVRKVVGGLPILVPGVGAQGGVLRDTIHAGRDDRAGGLIINSSRGILYASSGPDFAEAAGIAARTINGDMVRYFIE